MLFTCEFSQAGGEIYTIQILSCPKSLQILDILCPAFLRAGGGQKLYPDHHPCLAARHVVKFL